jgi:hypothetical protein
LQVLLHVFAVTMGIAQVDKLVGEVDLTVALGQLDPGS